MSVIQRHFSLMIKLTRDWSNYRRYAFARMLRDASYSYQRLSSFAFWLIHHRSNGSRNREASAERFLVTGRCRLIGDAMIVQTFLIAANGLGERFTVQTRRSRINGTPSNRARSRLSTTGPVKCSFCVLLPAGVMTPRKSSYYPARLSVRDSPVTTGPRRGLLNEPLQKRNDAYERVVRSACTLFIDRFVTIDRRPWKAKCHVQFTCRQSHFWIAQFLSRAHLIDLHAHFWKQWGSDAYSSRDLIFREGFSGFFVSSFFIFPFNLQLTSRWPLTRLRLHRRKKKSTTRRLRATRVEKYHSGTNWSISCASNYVKNQEREKEGERRREKGEGRRIVIIRIIGMTWPECTAGIIAPAGFTHLIQATIAISHRVISFSAQQAYNPASRDLSSRDHSRASSLRLPGARQERALSSPRGFSRHRSALLCMSW